MTLPTPRRLIKAGIERLSAQPDLPRHQHHEAYVTVVFKGAYEQASYVGRFTAGAGDVILQPTFDCHSDRMLSQGVELLRLPWRRELGLGGVFDGLPADEIRRAAERDVMEATAMVEDLLQVRSPRPTEAGHSADLLAMALVKSPDVRIEAWAERQGLARATVSRPISRPLRRPSGAVPRRGQGADGLGQTRVIAIRVRGHRLRSGLFRSGAHDPRGEMADRKAALRVAERRGIALSPGWSSCRRAPVSTPDIRPPGRR